ncbi:hypothetical protein GGI02_003983, partial [Coemansia sp. RSA 2322]
QQELQPGMFASKTFHWMEHGGSTRDQSWTKIYGKDMPTDPLAYSSSSLFTAPRAAPSALQRTAANLSPHRMLQTFRRQRQNSDAASRPPSGISSSFQPRRRGFTAPPGSQPPPFDISRNMPLPGSLGSNSSGRHDTPASHDVPAADPLPPVQEPPPIRASIIPHSSAGGGAPTSQCARDLTGNGAAAAAGAHMPFAGRRATAGRKRSDRDLSFSSCLFPSLDYAQPPQLHSSFSPPVSPHPRTICSKARSLMHRVRHLTPGSQSQSSDRVQHGNGLQGGGRLGPLRGTAPAQQHHHSPLGNNDGHHSVQGQRAGSPLNSRLRASVSRGYSRRSAPRRPPPPPEPGSARAHSRALPRSPLANPLILSDDAASEHVEIVVEPADPVLREVDSLSSDEEMVKCETCLRYKGADWVVHCNAGHALCFGCVQGHVQALLADKPSADVVFCFCEGCQSYITSKYLRRCLSPQRFKQIVDNCVKGYEARQLVKRSTSLYTMGKDLGEDHVGKFRSANMSQEGFDEPVIVADASSGLDPFDVANHASGGEGVAAEVNGLLQAVGGMAVSGIIPSNEQRLSASMPALQHSQSAAPLLSAPPPAALVSELTSIKPGSINSVVLAASVAADSTLTLSPESVGSRLRRVPKAQENVRQQSPGSNAAAEAPETLSDYFGQPALASTRQVEQQPPACPLYDYVSMDLDTYMHTPRPLQLPQFVPAASPMSWSGQRSSAHSSCQPGQQPTPAWTPPPVPPSMPAHFRASATWITPEQRYSGYTENILLSATLFETIRRKSSPVDGYESDRNSLDDSPIQPRPSVAPRAPMPRMAEERPAAGGDDCGVYIPTWRRSDEARPQHPMPLWAGAEFGSQSGVLCEAAELNFDLYETLHRRH